MFPRKRNTPEEIVSILNSGEWYIVFAPDNIHIPKDGIRLVRATLSKTGMFQFETENFSVIFPSDNFFDEDPQTIKIQTRYPQNAEWINRRKYGSYLYSDVELILKSPKPAINVEMWQEYWEQYKLKEEEREHRRKTEEESKRQKEQQEYDDWRQHTITKLTAELVGKQITNVTINGDKIDLELSDGTILFIELSLSIRPAGYDHFLDGTSDYRPAKLQGAWLCVNGEKIPNINRQQYFKD